MLNGPLDMQTTPLITGLSPSLGEITVFFYVALSAVCADLCSSFMADVLDSLIVILIWGMLLFRFQSGWTPVP